MLSVGPVNKERINELTIAIVFHVQLESEREREGERECVGFLCKYRHDLVHQLS